MKERRFKMLLIIGIVILKSSNSFSQQYNKLLGSTNQWNISTSFEGCGTYFSFTLGDTSILGVDYYKLYCPRCGINSDTPLVALIREDTLLRKVFLRRYEYPNILDSIEILYYDFSLLLNDSVFLYDPNIINSQWTQYGAVPLDWYSLDSITTVNTTVGIRTISFLRKKVLLSNEYDYLWWIEGIGAVYGFYISGCNLCSSWLDCEFKDGVQQFDGSQNLYLFPDNECICNTIGVMEIDLRDLISIYPNPVQTKLSVEFPNMINENGFFKIYDLYGNLKTGSQEITNKNIDVGNLSNGIYFIELNVNDDIIRKPFIKM